MNRRQRVVHVVALVVIVVCALALPAVAEQPADTAVDQGTRHAVVERLDRMPLLFVPEPVSPDGAMGYAVRGSEASVWLSAGGLSYRLHQPSSTHPGAASAWVVALDLVGATPRQPVGEDQLPTKVSYFKGRKEHWRNGLPSYGSVRYREPWPGIDVVVSGTAGELESTFVVRPGADPGQIRLAYRGAEGVRLEADGSLVVRTPLGEIRELAPIAYQEVNGQRVAVAVAFELDESSEPGLQAYRFRLGEFDRAHELVVDPVTLVSCGYIGGSAGDGGTAIAVDSAGNAYITGSTESSEATFPVAIGPDLSYNGGDYGDAFVAKVVADGSGLAYCGYIGGSGWDAGKGIAVDAAGNAYVTGYTQSTEATFPVAVGPDLSYNGGARDGFVAKVDADGTDLEYCGYIGGWDDDACHAIAVGQAGKAYLTGITWSTEASFPVTVGPDLTFAGWADAFAAKVNAAGTGLDYCGYVGGSLGESGVGIAVDAAESAYITGDTGSDETSFPVTVGPDLSYNGGMADAFVAKVLPAGTGLAYCGYIGGASEEWPSALALDSAGNAYIAGTTSSTESTFPVTVGPDLSFNGPQDAFVAKVDADGAGLAYCGYIGGSADDGGFAIAADAAGNAYVTGYARSTEATFPVAIGPDLSYNGGVNWGDAFVAMVRQDGSSLAYCGYIGGSNDEIGYGIAAGAAGNAWVTGGTLSSEATFPVTVGPDLSHNGDCDAFLVRLWSSDVFSDGFESGDTSAWSATVP